MQCGRSVAAADLNGDGVLDPIVSEPMPDTTAASNKGRVFAYLPNMTKTISGTENNSGFGMTLSTAGDLDGDGFDDLIIGEPFASGSGVQRGRFNLYATP